MIFKGVVYALIGIIVIWTISACIVFIHAFLRINTVYEPSIDDNLVIRTASCIIFGMIGNSCVPITQTTGEMCNSYDFMAPPYCGRMLYSREAGIKHPPKE